MQPGLDLSRWLSLVAALAVTFATTVVSAGPKQARKYYEKAKKAYAAEEYDRAASLLKKAYSEEANLTYQYNRIRALQGAKRYEKALKVLETYEQPMLDAKGFEDIPEIKKELQEQVGTSGSGTTTEEPSSTSANATGGSGDETTTTTETEPASTSGSGNMAMQALGWSLSGVGVASLGTGALFGSTLLLPDNYSQTVLRTHKTATAILLGAGGATLITGGILLYTHVFSSSPRRAAVDAPRVRWSPYATSEGIGAVLDIRY